MHYLFNTSYKRYVASHDYIDLALSENIMYVTSVHLFTNLASPFLGCHVCPYFYIIKKLFLVRKFKKLAEKCAFFSNFPKNLANFFHKLPQILALCTIAKFRSTIEKSDAPNILSIPSTEKSCINYCSLSFYKGLEV